MTTGSFDSEEMALLERLSKVVEQTLNPDGPKSAEYRFMLIVTRQLRPGEGGDDDDDKILTVSDTTREHLVYMLTRLGFDLLGQQNQYPDAAIFFEDKP